MRAKRILLVEDDDAHARLVALELAGASDSVIDRVSDGDEAMSYLKAEGRFAEKPPPDVVLLDLKLPRVSGHEVLRWMKDDESLRPIPVVILSTSDAQADKAQAFHDHANSYVVKPMEFDEFSRMIHDVVQYWTTWNSPVAAAT